MGYHEDPDWLRQWHEGESNRDPAFLPGISPGKRTLTMNLPARSAEARTAQPMQRKSEPTEDAEHEKREASTADWMNIAVRPDLHEVPGDGTKANHGPVQMKGGDDVHELAVQGISGSATALTFPAMAQLVGTDAGTVDSEGLMAASRLGSGLPVPDGIRTKVETVTGADLGSVRLHHDAAAESTAAALGARAWTLGNNVHFGAGQYQPGSVVGDRLIAHELVHTIQQAESGPVTQRKLEVSQPGDPSETEADTLADLALHQSAPAARAGGKAAPSALQRRGVTVRTPVPLVQPSFISYALKMGAKKASKAMLKKFIKEQIKDKLKKIAFKNLVKRFAKEADDIIGMLEDPWWVTAIGLIPVVGDAFDLVRVPKQIAGVIKKADRLQERVHRILKIQGRRASELIPATLQKGDSWAGELAEKTYAEIVELSASSEKAAKMKKLIEQEARLMEKLQ